jgi:uracil-DNA glycosylase
MNYQFPFGQPLRPVHQKDRSPKDIFILGVYASAVHAQWRGPDNKVLVTALAVASEPYIFWRGEDAEQIIASIPVPEGAGTLRAAAEGLNGPSGIALDEHYLKPLGHDRSSAWLCDLLPESRMNPSQAKAIKWAYAQRVIDFHLPPATVPKFDKGESNTDARREEILAELDASQAQTLVLLGDIPIQQFLKPLCSGVKVKDLTHLTELAGAYGEPWKTEINGRSMKVIGLCHPRQAAKLGSSSAKWHDLHKTWADKKR